MNVTGERFIVQMTQSELWDTAWDVRRALEHSIKTHWINHQDSWKENEKPRLDRLREFFTKLGQPQMYQEIYNIAEIVFKEFNNTNK